MSADTDLRDQAVQALKRSTVSYPTWAKNVADGKYPDPALTEWGKAFGYLEKIGVVVPPTHPIPRPPRTLLFVAARSRGSRG